MSRFSNVFFIYEGRGAIKNLKIFQLKVNHPKNNI